MKMKDKRNEAGSDKSRSKKHGFRPGQSVNFLKVLFRENNSEK